MFLAEPCYRGDVTSGYGQQKLKSREKRFDTGVRKKWSWRTWDSTDLGSWFSHLKNRVIRWSMCASALFSCPCFLGNRTSVWASLHLHWCPEIHRLKKSRGKKTMKCRGCSNVNELQKGRILTDEVVGLSNVIVPNSHLQSLFGEICIFDVITELL